MAAKHLVGPGKRLFGNPESSPDEAEFQFDHTSDNYFESPYYELHESLAQPVPTDPPAAPLNFADIVGEGFAGELEQAKKITFHSVGDTGAAKLSSLPNEEHVADAMVADLSGPMPPAFFFHLGDVVYQFPLPEYYGDQFYEAYREYDRPIFAIPGNHDGVVWGTDLKAPALPTLQAFRDNFCTEAPVHPPFGGGLVRTTMTQPGVYFTLDAPCVSVIGLYTNVLEGPGLITDVGGKYPALTGDGQYDWLVEELKRLAGPRKDLDRAVVLACHHPPTSGDTTHGGSRFLAEALDRAFEAAGFWPDAIVSGHAHLYQRFMRHTGTRMIPYIVAGSGGYNARIPSGKFAEGALPPGYTLAKGPFAQYGYLTVTVDLSGPKTLEIDFRAPSEPKASDSVTLDLSTNQVIQVAGKA
jgi:hypothetical protein